MLQREAAPERPGDQDDENRNRTRQQNAGPAEPTLAERRIEHRRPEAHHNNQRQRRDAEYTGITTTTLLQSAIRPPDQPCGAQQRIAAHEREATEYGEA